VTDRVFKLPPKQEAIPAKCFHPSGTFVEFPKEEIEQSIPDRFEQIVAAHSGRLAVKTNRAELTYEELNRTANRVAHALLARHESVEEPVLLLLDNGAPMIASIIGALKAAKIYVPLDPSFPTLRHREILEDTAAGLIVTDSKNLSLAAELAAGKLALVNIDELDRSASDDNPRPRAAPDTPAYILYTSGSTGTPKGIMHTHRSGLSFAVWAAETYGLTADDRVSNHAPLHFDLSTFDFFAAAQVGATTVIVPEAIAKLPSDVGRLMERERLTVWYSVPFALIQLLERGNLKSLDLGLLRWILFAGEVFPTKHLRRLLAVLPHVRFSNLFGPTETNVCTYYHVPTDLPTSEEPIPIGKPCGNIESLVVDGNEAPVAQGEPGELLIRGGVVMCGYWGRPDLNEAAFSSLSVSIVILLRVMRAHVGTLVNSSRADRNSSMPAKR